MRVKCIAQHLTETQAQLIAVSNYAHLLKQSFSLKIDKEYLVYGISILGGIAWVQLERSGTLLAYNPLYLFHIIDGRVSKYWEVRYYENGDLTIWPSSFYKEFYHSDLANDVPEIVEDFRRVGTLLEEEANAV